MKKETTTTTTTIKPSLKILSNVRGNIIIKCDQLN